MGRKINVGLLILVLFTALACIFYYPIFFGKIPFNGNLLVAFFSPWEYRVPFKFMGVDEIREFFPLLDFTYDALRTGQIPLWNPYNFSGYPHLANWASAVFYPLHLSMFLLNKLWTFIFMKLSAIVLSGFFTYLYLRVLSLDKKAAFFGGLTFAFSSTMLIWGAEIWQAAHSILWLPLVLFSIEKFISEKKFPYIVLGALGLAISLMAGYIQPSLYLYLLVLAYILMRARLDRKMFIPFFLMFLLSVGFSAVHTFPAVEAFTLSPRSEISLTDVNIGFLLPFSSFVTFFVPDIFGHVATQNWFAQRPGQYYESLIYVGVVPLVLVPLSLFLTKMRGYALFFFVWLFFSLSMVFDLPTSRLVYLLNFPFLSTAIPIRIIFIAVFSLSVLSAFGIRFWFGSTKKERNKMLLVLAPLLLIYLAIGVWLFVSFVQKATIVGFPPNWFIISLRNFVLPTFVFLLALVIIIGGIFFRTARLPAYFFLLTLFLAHSFLFAHKYFAFTSSQFFYPSHPLLSYLKENLGLGRYWGYGKAALFNNFATVYKIYSPEGYDPVNVRHYNELLSSSNTGDFRGIASRSDAVIPNANIFPPDDTNAFRLKILDLLGVELVGYFTEDKKQIGGKILENDRFTLVWQEVGFMVFKNKKAYKRAFLVKEAISADSREDIIKMVYDSNTDLAKKVILEEKINLENFQENTGGDVQITEYSPNKVLIKAWTNTPQLLVLSDAYYPGWQATIDGNPTKIYKADYALRAVLVPKGEHEVAFSFKPLIFLLGLIVTIGNICIVSCILIFTRVKSKDKRWV